MLLRFGVISLAVSVLLATAVTVVVGFKPEAPEALDAQTEPLASEGATTERENDSDPGEKLDIDEPEPAREVPAPRAAKAGKEPQPLQPRSAPSASSPAPATPQGSSERLPISNADWPPPTSSELAQVARPRYYAPESGANMTLTIEALGLYDVPVFSSSYEQTLEQGVLHVPDTAYPWDNTSQKNVYLAAHNLGWPGTTSRLLFYNLDALRDGDAIYLTDPQGRSYRYTVSDLFAVWPEDAWVADTLVGRDLLTLQTCTPYPTFEKRLIVRADRA